MNAVLDLVPVWTLILGAGIFFYVLLDGFDLGVGMLYGFMTDARSRNTVMNAIAPVWDGNETWLVLGGVGLLAAFPLAFAIVVPALYFPNFPIVVMLLALVFRGVAFEFRFPLVQANCSSGFRCKLPSCYICSQIYWKRRRKLLGSLCAGMGRDDLSWGTVLVGVSHSGFPVMEDMIKDFSEKFYLSLSTISGVRWSGRFEIDYIDGKLGSAKTYKEQTLAELGYCKDHELAGLVLHVHFVMIHPGLRREQITYRLRKCFRASRQVRLSPLRVTRDLEDSFDALVRIR
jgi:hypothetical protein